MNQELTGKFIAQLRKEKNLTQKELADKLGILANAALDALMNIFVLKEVKRDDFISHE